MIRAGLALVAGTCGSPPGSAVGHAVPRLLLMIVALVPFALGPDMNLLARSAPPSVARAVLATLIGLDRLFQADEEDGSLDLMTGRRTAGRRRARQGAAHWLTTGLPLALASPLFGLLVALDGPAMGADRPDAGTRHARPQLHRRGGRALTASIRRGG